MLGRAHAPASPGEELHGWTVAVPVQRREGAAESGEAPRRRGAGPAVRIRPRRVGSCRREQRDGVGGPPEARLAGRRRTDAYRRGCASELVQVPVGPEANCPAPAPQTHVDDDGGNEAQHHHPRKVQVNCVLLAVAVREEDPECCPHESHGDARAAPQQPRGALDQRGALLGPELREAVLVLHNEVAQDGDDLLVLHMINMFVRKAAPDGRRAHGWTNGPSDDVPAEVLQLRERELQPVVHSHLAPEQEQEGPEGHDDGPGHQVDPGDHKNGVVGLYTVLALLLRLRQEFV
mmetsp:Transcript_83040/g.262377  ORF Transcript_83040/g.262377 Transcript_83040/m.262377 type:complete len:291 (+) Transcript_83040:3-875(+)